MNRRNFIKMAGCAGLTILSGGLLAGITERPNVLIFFTDDQRASNVGALGNKHITPPILTGLCQEAQHSLVPICVVQ